MVTKKTRLMSAFAAVLMLVSLFASFVLPVTADTSPNSITAYHDSVVAGLALSANDDYTVSSLEELELLSLYKTTLKGTIYITADITFPDDYTPGVAGADATAMSVIGDAKKATGGATFKLDGDMDKNGTSSVISNMKVHPDTTAWLGYHYEGGSVKNLVFKNCSFTPNGDPNEGKNYTAFLVGYPDANSTFDNLVFDGCRTSNENNTFNAGSAADNCRPSLLLAQVIYDCTVSNITIKNCSIKSNVGNTGFVVGQVNHKGTTVFKNILMYNNTLEGDGFVSTAVFAGEFGTAASKVTMDNIGVFNTKLQVTTKPNGLLVGTLDGKATVNANNIVAFGNDMPSYETLFCGHYTSSTGTGTLNGTNIYSDGPSARYVYAKEEHDACDATVTDVAEALWLANKTIEAPSGREAQKLWTMDGTTPAFGDESNQTVHVEFWRNDTYYSHTYVDLNETVDLTTLCDIAYATYASSDATIDGNNMTITTAPANEDLTVRVDVTAEEREVADTTPLTEWIAAFNASGKNAEYYSADGTEAGETLAAAIERVEANIVGGLYASASEVEAEIANLESYKMWKVVDITEFETYTTAAPGYEVDSVADLETVSSLSGSFTASQTIYIADDIDFGGESYTGAAINLGALQAGIDGSKAPGGVATISNLYTTRCWIGDMNASSYDQAKISFLKNLKFYDCHSTETAKAGNRNSALIIGGVYADCDIENVTLDSCSADLSGSTASVTGGLLIGRVANCKLNLTDITIKNSTLHRGNYDGATPTSCYIKSGLAVAKGSDGTILTVDGLYMIDNEITGLRRGLGAGIAFGEIFGPTDVKNVGIFNTTIEASDGSAKLGNTETDSNIKGILIGQIKGTDATTLKVENVITANNKVLTPSTTTDGYEEVAVDLIYNTNEITGVEIKNIYTDASTVRRTEVTGEVIANANANEGAAIASGEAAYALNQVVDQKWAMTAEGVPTFATTGLPIKITLVAADPANPDNGINEDRYTDETGKVIIDEELLFAAFWEGEALTQRVFTEETTVNGTLVAEHDHEWIYVFDADADTHTATCSFGDGSCPGVIETTACEFTATAPANTVAPADAKHIIECVCGNRHEEACTTSSNTTNATCYVPGSVVTTCAVCDYEHTDVLTREHQLSYQHVEGTSGDESKHLCTCGWDDCDYEEEAACTFGAWDVVGATKDQEGTKTRVCSDCGYNDVVILPKLASLDVKAGTGALGQTVTVRLNLVNNPGVAGMTVEFAYDSNVFTLIDVTAGDLNADQFVSAIKPDGTVTNKVTFANAGNITADGMIAELTFKVSDTATAGDYEIAVTNTAVDNDGKEVAIENIVGTITVVEFIKGDVNGDGFTTMADAVLLLRYVSGIDINMSVNEQAVDLIAEGNDTLGAVNINDVVYLLQYLSDWCETL